MASSKDLEDLTEKKALAKAARLGVPDCPGIPLGKDMRSGKLLYASWEDVMIGIAGPRVGKTTSCGPRDHRRAGCAHHDVEQARHRAGHPWPARRGRHDVGVRPAAVVDEEPTWWWNPLSYVIDDTTAAKLAGHFDAGSRKSGDKGDAFFDPAGLDLLTGSCSPRRWMAGRSRRCSRG